MGDDGGWAAAGNALGPMHGGRLLKAPINLKKSVELNSAKNIQHKLDRQMRIMGCV
jgi:hypothetical protein